MNTLQKTTAVNTFCLIGATELRIKPVNSPFLSQEALSPPAKK
jgi:hypothetical protein